MDTGRNPFSAQSYSFNERITLGCNHKVAPVINVSPCLQITVVFCLSFNNVLLELAYSKHKLRLEFKASKMVVAGSRSSAFTFSFRFSSCIFPFGSFSRSSSHPYWMYELILSHTKKYHIKTSLTISYQNYKSGSFQQATANMSIMDRDVIGT